ncbi:hypothetical protein [Candidatus Vidania fulgoroideorum]
MNYIFKKKILNIIKKNKCIILYGQRDFFKIKFSISLYKNFEKFKLKIFTSFNNFLYSKNLINKIKKKKIFKKKIILNLKNVKNYFNIIYCIEDCDFNSLNILKKIIENNKKIFFIFISFDINKINKNFIDRLIRVKINDNYYNLNLEYYKKFHNFSKFLISKKSKKKKKKFLKNYKLSINNLYIYICLFIKKKHKKYFFFFYNLYIFLNNKNNFIKNLYVLILKFF